VNVASIAGAQWMANLERGSSDCWPRRRLRTVWIGWGINPIDGARAYNFSKEAVLVWTMANCLRWWDRQIRVNAVSPGPVDTPILDDFRDSMGHDRIAAAISCGGSGGSSTKM
jgi:NAD(P)-dependent dehydrogenase (short-subunit alcohol dehydrogenase family)